MEGPDQGRWRLSVGFGAGDWELAKLVGGAMGGIGEGGSGSMLLETNRKRHQAGNGWMDWGLFALFLVEGGGNFSG